MQANQASDPVIDEVREVRRRISARFGHDPERLVAYYRQLQEKFRERLVESAVAPLVSDQIDADEGAPEWAANATIKSVTPDLDAHRIVK